MTNDTLIDERSLREALRPARPEPEAFEDAVLRKIEERERRAALLERSTFLRQAAGLLPPGLAPMTPVAAAGEKVFAKLAATIFAMPVLVLAMTGITFVAGLRSLRGLDARHVGQERSFDEARTWWRTHAFAAFLVLALFTALGMMRSIDLLLGLVVLSMLVLTWVLRRLSAAGLAGRRQVGMLCGYLLFMTTMGIAPLRQLLGVQHSGAQGFLVYALLFVGGLICYYLAIPEGGDPRTGLTRAGALLIFLPFLAVVLGLQVLFWNPKTVGMTRAELIDYVEGPAPALDRSPDWRALREAVLWLQRAGGDDLDLTPSRAAFRDALARGDEISNYVLGDAADLGWIEDGDWESVLEEGQVRRLRQGSGKIPFLRQMRASLHGLVETGALGDAGRDRLADRLILTWDGGDKHARLELLAEIVRDLELIGRENRLARLTPTVRAALVDAWMPKGVRRESDAGGFVVYYRQEGEFASAQATGEAIRLMERFGVPEEIDLARVREYLRGEATRYANQPVSSVDVERAVALASLERDLAGELPVDRTPTFLQLLLAWRLTIGVFLLTALYVYATLRAPGE